MGQIDWRIDGTRLLAMPRTGASGPSYWAARDVIVVDGAWVDRGWVAYLGRDEIARGTLQDCLDACEESEAKAADPDRPTAARLLELANSAFASIRDDGSEQAPDQDTVRGALHQFDRLLQSRGLAWVIDAAGDTGMTHLGLTQWLSDARSMGPEAEDPRCGTCGGSGYVAGEPTVNTGDVLLSCREVEAVPCPECGAQAGIIDGCQTCDGTRLVRGEAITTEPDGQGVHLGYRSAPCPECGPQSGQPEATRDGLWGWNLVHRLISPRFTR